jgi:hypothetical protein
MKKKQIISNEKANVRMAALATTTSSGVVYMKNGHQRSIDDQVSEPTCYSNHKKD